MRDRFVWSLIHDALQRNCPAALMVVIDSQGSSPGRLGFKMAVDLDGNLAGSIGGGTMEFDLVEKAKKLLGTHRPLPVVIEQIHNQDVDANCRSGLLCSGSQKVVIYPIRPGSKMIFEQLNQPVFARSSTILQLTPTDITLIQADKNELQEHYVCQFESETAWCYRENLFCQKVLYIVGGGHVSLALSRIMETLHFYVVVFDDRPLINTLTNNGYAREKHIIEYQNIAQYIEEGPRRYLVIMTASHKADDIVLEQVIHKKLDYLGMMASKEKAAIIFDALMQSGVSSESLKKVHSPVGLAIQSQTPEEIAVSIAAEIIQTEHHL